MSTESRSIAATPTVTSVDETVTDAFIPVTAELRALVDEFRSARDAVKAASRAANEVDRLEPADYEASHTAHRAWEWEFARNNDIASAIASKVSRELGEHGR
jgi:hypothetical protein